MEIAKIEVSRADARRIYCGTLTSGMVGVEVSFSFDASWDGLVRLATFKAGGTKKDVALKTDRAEIPHEVLAKPCSRLEVGVYGTDADGALVIPTVWADLGNVIRGAEPSGETTKKPTPEVWVQILGMIGDIGKLDTENKENLVAAINEILHNGTDLEEVQRIVQEYLDENFKDLEDGKDGFSPHKSRLETTTGGVVGQVPIIKGLDSRGIPNAWEFGEFAPSGYGLGNASPKVISGIDALNNAKDNGWYYVTDLGWRYFGGVTVNLALVHVLSKDRYHVRQILYPAAMSVIIRREYHGASWTDWCCENPPMNPGMEYRTTELCEGLPVYAKRITHTLSEAIGNTTDNTDISIAHNITNLNFLVRCFGRKGNYPIPSYGAAGGSISINQVGPSNIILRCYRDTLSPGTIHFDLYYTKTG